MMENKIKYKLAGVVCVVISTCLSGCAPQSQDVSAFMNVLNSKIACPNVHPMFGNFPVCSTGYDISNDIITLNMKLSEEKKYLLPIDKWKTDGTESLNLQVIVCDAMSRALGITRDAILHDSAGIIQRVSSINDNGFSEETTNMIASKLRVVLKIDDYIVTRWAFVELNQVPMKCTVDRINKKGF